jgi:hypothetical protein
MVKFLRFNDKMSVQERAKNSRETNIFLNEDFSEAVRQRKELIPAMKAARERGGIAYISYHKLIVHPPKSLGGVREPSFWISSFSPTSHMHKHTYTN